MNPCYQFHCWLDRWTLQLPIMAGATPCGKPYTKPDKVTRNVKPNMGGVDVANIINPKIIELYEYARIRIATLWMAKVMSEDVEWLKEHRLLSNLLQCCHGRCGRQQHQQWPREKEQWSVYGFAFQREEVYTGTKEPPSATSCFLCILTHTRAKHAVAHIQPANGNSIRDKNVDIDILRHWCWLSHDDGD